MRHPTIMLLVILISPLCLSAQDGYKITEALKTKLKTATGTDRVDALLNIGDDYLWRDGQVIAILDSAENFLNDGQELARQLDYKAGIDQGIYLLGKLYLRTRRKEEFLALLNECDEKNRARLATESVGSLLATEGDLNKSNPDSLAAVLEKSLETADHYDDVTTACLALILSSKVAFNSGELPKSREHLRRAIKKAQQARSLSDEGEIFGRLNYLQLDESFYPEYIELGESVRRQYTALPSSYEKTKIEKKLLNGYEVLSYYHIGRGNLHLALSTSLKSIDVLEQSGNPAMISVAYVTIGKIYLETGDFEKAVSHLLTGRAIAWKQGNAFFPIGVRHAVRAYIGLNRTDEGLKFLTECVEHGGYDDDHSKRLIAECYAVTHVARKEFLMAEKYYLEALAIQKKSKVVNDRLLSLYTPMARLYIQTKEYEKAKGYLKDLLNDSHIRIVPANVQRDAYYLLFQIDSIQGKPNLAMLNLYKYQQLNDTLFNERKNRQLEELTVKYETDKKDRDLDLLRNQTELQEADLRNASFIRNALMGGAAVLIIILALVYSRYRLKQRTTGQLQKLLGEKEWLVREIHHRVKNNLQIVISLLRTHAALLSEGDALSAINESESRIQVISLLHQKLYQVDTSSNIDMKAYVPELVNCILEGTGSNGNIRYGIDIDDVKLDISQAVPIGLILNEAITNAVKYAKQSDVEVYLKKRNDNQLTLAVSDHGPGLPKDFDLRNVSSMGMKLINTLTDQLEGKLSLHSNGGTTLQITFRSNVKTVQL